MYDYPVDVHLVRNRRVAGPHADNGPAYTYGIGSPVAHDVMRLLCDSFRELLKKIEMHSVKNQIMEALYGCVYN